MTAPYSVLRAVLLLTLVPTGLCGQAQVRARESLHAQPDGGVIAVLEPGLRLGRAGGRDGWLEVDVEGWVRATSVRPTNSGGHDLVVEEQQSDLREGPSSPILARFHRGALLDEQERRPGWVRVRRRAWIPAASVDTAAATARIAAAGPPPARATEPPPSGNARLDDDRSALLDGPAGDTIARLGADARLEVVAREGNWARVRVEGWVRMPAGDSVLDRTPVEVSPAELAADPERFRGRVVSWDLQFLSLERAERIRTDFSEGEPFLLTRHAAGGYVYVAVPADRLAEAESLLALERIQVRGRVRTPAAAPTGSPILDLIELRRARDRR